MVHPVIQIKLETGQGYQSRIHNLCWEYLKTSDVELLKRLSVYTGEMAHTLRAALNNALWDLAEKKLKSKLSQNEYGKLMNSHDFPIEMQQDRFDQHSRVVRHLAEHFPAAYKTLKEAQPFYNPQQNYALWGLKRLSNASSHTWPVNVVGLKANDILVMVGTRMQFHPKIVGDQVVVPGPNGEVIAYQTPSYIRTLGFASASSGFVQFHLEVEDRQSLSLMEFVLDVNDHVRGLIHKLYAHH